MTAGHDVDQAQAQPGQLSGPVLDSLAGQLEGRARARQAEADRAKARDDRGCVDCGATLSWIRPGLGGWHPGPRCHRCWSDRAGDAGAGTDDTDARVKACELVLGTIGPPAWATVVPGPPTVAARWLPEYKAKAFRWFSEVIGARPAPGGQRFAYTSAEELRDRLYEGREPPPPQLHSRGKRHRCEQCDARGQVWLVDQVALAAPLDSRGEPVSRMAGFRLTWTCSRCRHTDTEQQAEQLPGVPVSGLTGG